MPKRPAGTLCVIGDLKGMDARFLRGVTMVGYGTTLGVGVGVPIPILDEEMAFFTSVADEDIVAPIVDYSRGYPEANYQDLRSGTIKIGNKEVPTGPISSLFKAREIAQLLKGWIEQGRFVLTEPVAKLPGKESGITFKAFRERPIDK